MTDIATLFARDPHTLTRDDLAQLIQYYRDHRKQFVTNGERKTGTTKPSGKAAGVDLGEIKL